MTGYRFRKCTEWRSSGNTRHSIYIALHFLVVLEKVPV